MDEEKVIQYILKKINLFNPTLGSKMNADSIKLALIICDSDPVKATNYLLKNGRPTELDGIIHIYNEILSIKSKIESIESYMISS